MKITVSWSNFSILVANVYFHNEFIWDAMEER